MSGALKHPGNVERWNLSVTLTSESDGYALFNRPNANRGDIDLSLAVPRYIWEGTLGRATVLALQIEPFVEREPDDDTAPERWLEDRIERIERELAQLRRDAYARRMAGK